MAGGHINEQQVRDLAKQGMRQHEIAKQIGCSQSAILYFVKRHNIFVDTGRKNNLVTKNADSAQTDQDRIRQVVAESGAEPMECTIRQMTPEEALKAKVKLPWSGKVEIMTPNHLTPELFEKLMSYGVDNIRELYGFKSVEAYGVWLKKYGLLETYPLSAFTEESEYIETCTPTPEEIEEFFTDAAIEHDIEAAPAGPDPSQWEALDGKPKTYKNPTISIGDKKCYLGKAARELLNNPSELTIRISPDGKMLGLRNGGPVNVSKAGDEISASVLSVMLYNKGLSLPAKYFLTKQGDWVIGELEAVG